MRKIYFLSLAAILVVSFEFAQSHQTSIPAKWIAGGPIFSAGPKGTFDDVAVKDPTIVNYKGKWHLFYTISAKDPDGIGYACSDDLQTINNKPRYWLKQFKGLTSDETGGAPQIFYFQPQKLWYLIYQTKDFNRQPVYSTTATIEKPTSWSKTKNLIIREEPDVKWIDFWIICDDDTAYFFYCRGRKDVYVRTTKITDFPDGFGPAKLAFSPMPKPLTEAAHIYKVKDKHQYHMFYETRPTDDLSRSYGLAAADNLMGPWKRVTNQYANGKKLIFAENVDQWTDVISHGEMIRTGYDQKLEYDPQNTQFLIQGKIIKKQKTKTKNPGYQLGIIKPALKTQQPNQ